MPAGAIADLATGIIGSGGRRAAEQEAIVEQREAEYNYKNFDYNQDVGPINNPYADVAQRQQEFLQENIDRSSANQLHQQQQSGNAGAAQAIIASQTDAARKASQQVQAIRDTGAKYVEQQRQDRIQQRYGQAKTFLGRADKNLAQAKAARQRATEKLVSGIAGIGTAVVGGVAGGGGLGSLLGKEGAAKFNWQGALSGSGIVDSSIFLTPEQILAGKKDDDKDDE